MKKNTLISVLVLVVFLAGIVYLVYATKNTDPSEVIIEEETEIVEGSELTLGVNEENSDLSANDPVENVTPITNTTNRKLTFMECLVKEGVIIYGSKTCPYCMKLAEEFGGYEVIKPIYVECTEEGERCGREMLVNYVPAVQIKGVLFEGWGSPENLSKVTGCKL